MKESLNGELSLYGAVLLHAGDPDPGAGHHRADGWTNRQESNDDD